MMQALPSLVLVWRDGSGSDGEVRLNIKSSLPYASIETAAIELIAAVSALTDAVFVRFDIVYKFVPSSGMIGDPSADRLRVGVFVLDCTEPLQQGLVQIPAFNPDKFVTTGPGAGVLIDLDDSDVAAFVAVLTNGDYTNPFAFPLGSLVAAYRQSRL